MGHQRLGDIPKSRKWTAVVAAVAGETAGADGPGILAQAVAEIADLTLDAAEAGLQQAIDDPGLRYTFYLLTQIVLAAREPNWRSIDVARGSAVVGVIHRSQPGSDDCTRLK